MSAPRCLNPLPHEPHEWLAHSDAGTLSPCAGRTDHAAEEQQADFYAHLRNRADAVAAELDHRYSLLREALADPVRGIDEVEHTRGETVGMRDALGILLQPPGSSIPTQRFIEHVGDNHHQQWCRETQHRAGTHAYCGIACPTIKAAIDKQDRERP